MHRNELLSSLCFPHAEIPLFHVWKIVRSCPGTGWVSDLWLWAFCWLSITITVYDIWSTYPGLWQSRVFPKKKESVFSKCREKAVWASSWNYLAAFVNSSVNKLKHGISLLFKNYKRLWEATQEKQDRVIGNLTLLYSVFIQDSINHSPIVSVLLWSPFQIWNNPITVEITSKAQHVFCYWYRG